MTDRPTRINGLRSAAAALGVLLLAMTVAAQTPRGDGQRGPGPRFTTNTASMDRLLRPDFHARDMAILARQLELDHSQRPIFEMLLEDYREAFRDAAYDLEVALRHRQLQEIEQRLEQRMDRERSERPGEAEQAHAERAVIGRARSIDGGGDGQVMVVAQRGSGQDISRSGPVMITMIEDTDESPGRSGQQESRSGRDDNAPQPTVLHLTANPADGVVVEARATPPDVQERINRMRERILRRMEERVEQQREEMRQRGIDPDAEVEPMEPEEVVALAKSLLTKKEQLRTRFEADAHVLLTQRQREKLPETFRTIRRLNALPDSRLSGEQVDLLRVLDDHRLLDWNDPDLEAALHEYTTTLDQALTTRTRFLERADIDVFIAREDGRHDEVIALTESEIEHRIRVRQVNETFTDLLAALMHEEDGKRFTEAIEAETYPQVVRATPLERLLPRLLERDDLTPEQLQAVEHLRKQYSAAVQTHRQTMIETIRERETTEPLEMMKFTQRVREMRERGEDMRRIDWSEVRPAIPVQATMQFAHRRFDRSFFDQLRSVVPRDMLDQIAEDDETARSAINSLRRSQVIHYPGDRRGRRGQ